MRKLLLFSFFLFSTIPTACAQDYQSKAALEKEIVGTWHLENSPKDKIVFTKDGVVKRYDGEELQSTKKYSIDNTCGGEKLEKGYFLKETNTNNEVHCAYIEAINYNNSALFSLMTQHQGKTIVFQRQSN
jgi:hypothetical protein